MIEWISRNAQLVGVVLFFSHLRLVIDYGCPIAGVQSRQKGSGRERCLSLLRGGWRPAPQVFVLGIFAATMSKGVKLEGYHNG